MPRPLPRVPVSRRVAGRVATLGRAIGVALFPLSFTFALTLGGAVTSAPLTGCSGPRYPSCDHDDQCNTDGHHGVCLDHQCTECRDDTGCGVGQSCTSGACTDIKNYCDAKRPCDDGGECGEDKRCRKAEPKVAVECDDAHACAGASHCENGHCVSPPRGGPGCTDFPALHFDYDSRDLPGDSKSVLQRLAGCVTTGSLKGARVLLTGHCDPRGEYEFNMILGAERAENVKSMLTGLGVAGATVTTSSRGKLDATGTDERSWAQDRRVDVEIR
jgi:outer membrane protein OmpA-like peptidoglycan-associated protein